MSCFFNRSIEYLCATHEDHEEKTAYRCTARYDLLLGVLRTDSPRAGPEDTVGKNRGTLEVLDLWVKQQHMKKIATTLTLILIINLSSMAQTTLKDAVKEAAKGVVWMVKVEVCKVAMLLFSSKGYVCYHKEHKEIFNPEK